MMPVKIMVGKPAPDFTATAVIDGRLKSMSLNAYTAASHWVALVFYPKAWSFICPTEIRAFSARLEEFLYSRQCAVVFASTDSEFCLKAWNNTSELEGGLGGVHVPLISDSNHKISRDYGVLIEEEGVAERALFIIDPRGTVRYTSVSDVDVGRSVDETLRVIDALAFKDEFGEGCPVDWKKGEPGLKFADRARIEGPIDISPNKKSWSEWARPKLARAWSNTSARSIGQSSMASMNGVVNVTPPSPAPALYVESRTRSGSQLSDRNGSTTPSVPTSPLSTSRFSAADFNLEAAMRNHGIAPTYS